MSIERQAKVQVPMPIINGHGQICSSSTKYLAHLLYRADQVLMSISISCQDCMILYWIGLMNLNARQPPAPQCSGNGN
jgi:hypothetical protein